MIADPENLLPAGAGKIVFEALDRVIKSNSHLSQDFFFARNFQVLVTRDVPETFEVPPNFPKPAIKNFENLLTKLEKRFLLENRATFKIVNKTTEPIRCYIQGAFPHSYDITSARLVALDDEYVLVMTIENPMGSDVLALTWRFLNDFDKFTNVEQFDICYFSEDALDSLRSIFNAFQYEELFIERAGNVIVSVATAPFVIDVK